MSRAVVHHSFTIAGQHGVHEGLPACVLWGVTAPCCPAQNAVEKALCVSRLHCAGGNITAAARPRRRDCGTGVEAAARVAKIAPEHRTAVGQVRLRRARLVKAGPGWLVFAHQRARGKTMIHDDPLEAFQELLDQRWTEAQMDAAADEYERQQAEQSTFGKYLTDGDWRPFA